MKLQIFAVMSTRDNRKQQIALNLSVPLYYYFTETRPDTYCAKFVLEICGKSNS